MDGEVTQILAALRAGSPDAETRLCDAVYAELRRIAGACMRDQQRGHTLDPTALVHEAYLRLMGGSAAFADRAHFYRAAAKAMRHILVDHARARRTLKRGGDRAKITFNPELAGMTNTVDTILGVHEALAKLEVTQPQQAALVELRYFGGLEFDEIARVLDIAPRTTYRLWERARAWLFVELTP